MKKVQRRVTKWLSSTHLETKNPLKKIHCILKTKIGVELKIWWPQSVQNTLRFSSVSDPGLTASEPAAQDPCLEAAPPPGCRTRFARPAPTLRCRAGHSCLLWHHAAGAEAAPRRCLIRDRMGRDSCVLKICNFPGLKYLLLATKGLSAKTELLSLLFKVCRAWEDT